MRDARPGLEPGTAGLRVRRADHSATLPPNTFANQSTQPRFETETRATRKNHKIREKKVLYHLRISLKLTG